MSDLRPWFVEDMARVIKSVVFTALASNNEDYRRGFLACATAICMAFGIDIKDVIAEFEVFYQEKQSKP